MEIAICAKFSPQTVNLSQVLAARQKKPKIPHGMA